MLFQRVQQRYTYLSNKYNSFHVILSLTHHETPYNLNIVLSFHTPFEPEPITVFFTITGLWLKDNIFFKSRENASTWGNDMKVYKPRLKEEIVLINEW